MSNGVLDRINRRLKTVGISAAAASRAATGSPDTIRNIQRAVEIGRPRSITAATAEKLAKPLRTNAAWLLTGAGDEETTNPVDVFEVPIISWVSAGRLFHVEPQSGLSECPKLLMAGLRAGEWIALTIKGDSMDRVAPEGSHILVNRREKMLINGNFYVVLTSDGEATFKRYRHNPDRLEPFSTNSSHETIFINQPTEVIGTVRKVITDL
ncbi:LexA family protein [Rhodomicrobium lacus]|uniref:LexA family protein n=1 Tax=Rhodomicrobium lacus TaxID=2498452 RepID=UPI000F8C7CC3|nr:S24 family peptidase [Rhodomicrobium lacus]